MRVRVVTLDALQFMRRGHLLLVALCPLHPMVRRRSDGQHFFLEFLSGSNLFSLLLTI